MASSEQQQGEREAGSDEERATRVLSPGRRRVGQQLFRSIRLVSTAPSLTRHTPLIDLETPRLHFCHFCVEQCMIMMHS